MVDESNWSNPPALDKGVPERLQYRAGRGGWQIDAAEVSGGRSACGSAKITTCFGLRGSGRFLNGLQAVLWGDGDVGDSSGTTAVAAKCREAIPTLRRLSIRRPRRSQRLVTTTSLPPGERVPGFELRSCDRIVRGGGRLEKGRGSKKLTFRLRACAFCDR